jgi:membrane-associated protease RseP (regulator of RpoE activity)
VEITSIIENKIASYFSIKKVHIEEKEFYFIVYDYSSDKFLQLIEDLDKMGYLPFIDEYEGEYKIRIANKPKHGESRIHINVILFLITVISTVFAGYLFGGGKLIDGIAFAVALLAIIGSHETAHYFAAKKHGVKATLPYFIPAPTLVGTFGAVINVKSAIPNKNALFDLGVSGPIAGIIVTIPVLIIGVLLSTVAPMQNASIQFFPSILMYIPMAIAFPSVPEGYGVMLHPVAFAAWVGIVVTMLNLMPVGVLDGGHISRSLFKEKIHYYISIVGVIVTLFIGWYLMAILMAVFLFFVSRRHPGALDNVSKISKNRKIIAIIVIIIFILCLSPMPNVMV